MQDEITALRAGTPLTWRMLTRAAVVIDGRTAVLNQNGRTLRVEILSPANAVFSSRPATPPTARENQNEGITALEAAVPSASIDADVRIAILITPVGEKWPVRPPPDLTALDQWK